MECGSKKNAGSRCGTGSDKLERNIRNWVYKDIGNGHKVSDLGALN